MSVEWICVQMMLLGFLFGNFGKSWSDECRVDLCSNDDRVFYLKIMLKSLSDECRVALCSDDAFGIYLEILERAGVKSVEWICVQMMTGVFLFENYVEEFECRV